jgi:phage terminase large subunit GpA-like protein
MVKYRTKCPYCDYEFEYQREDLLYFHNTCVPKGVICPECSRLIEHNSDTPRSRTNDITTMQAKDYEG